MKRLSQAIFALTIALYAPLALAIGWGDYELGEFYQLSEVEDETILNASEAVVYFKGATGFIISPDGYILTNHHVWDGFGDSGTVYRHKTEDGYREALKIKLVVKSEKYDMALYKTEPKKALPYVPLRTTPTKVGEEVFIIGHPDSKPLRVSFGKILAKDITISGRPSIEYSAQTWWGSSGSPVLDKNGAVVALHWGWDSAGLSNGRLTGVPIAKMTKAINEIDAIASGTIEEVASSSCQDASLYSIETALVQKSKKSTRAHKKYFDLELTTKSADSLCSKEIIAVTYTLHPTFSDPVRGGDGSQSGFPLSITAWGMFPVKATIELRGGATLDVDGYVEW